MWAQPSTTPMASDPPHTAEQQFFPPLPPTKRSRLSRIPLSQTYRKPSSILESAEGNIISISILNFLRIPLICPLILLPVKISTLQKSDL